MAEIDPPKIEPITAKVLLSLHKTTEPDQGLKDLSLSFLTIYQKQLKELVDDSMEDVSGEGDEEWQGILHYLGDAAAVISLTKEAASLLANGSISMDSLSRAATLLVGYYAESRKDDELTPAAQALEYHLTTIFERVKFETGRDLLDEATSLIGRDSDSENQEIDDEAAKMINAIENVKKKTKSIFGHLVDMCNLGGELSRSYQFETSG